MGVVVAAGVALLPELDHRRPIARVGLDHRAAATVAGRGGEQLDALAVDHGPDRDRAVRAGPGDHGDRGATAGQRDGRGPVGHRLVRRREEGRGGHGGRRDRRRRDRRWRDRRWRGGSRRRRDRGALGGFAARRLATALAGDQRERQDHDRSELLHGVEHSPIGASLTIRVLFDGERAIRQVSRTRYRRRSSLSAATRAGRVIAGSRRCPKPCAIPSAPFTIRNAAASTSVIRSSSRRAAR